MKHSYYYHIIFFCWIIFLIACDFNTSENRVEQQSESKLVATEVNEKEECEHEDVLKLRDYKTLQSFYQSVHRWYDNSRIEPVEIFSNLNQKILSEFFNEIDINIFIKENAFSKKYHFNKAPKEYKDSEECLDNLSISFVGKELSARVLEQSNVKIRDYRCMFMLTAFNSFFVEDVGCTESQTFYYFVITGDEVEVLLIGMAG